MRARVLDVLVVAGFAAGIAAPLADHALRPASARRSVTVEYREPAPRPELALATLADYPSGFDAWYGDSFGLRDRLIRWHNVLHWLGLRTSPTRAVVRGREGWIFTTWGDAIESSCGLDPMNEEELERWRVSLELERDWLAERGIRFVYVVVPDKAAVYPELLPARLARRGPSRREQFLAYMAEHSDLEVVDLLPAIQAEKAWDAPGDMTYFELGDHWTDRGCLAGYRALVTALGVEPWPREDFADRPGIGQGDNFAARMYMSDLVRQAIRVLLPARNRGIHRTGDGDGERRAHWVHEDASLPRTLVFHDSFGVLIVPHVAAHFSDTLALWQAHVDPALVEEQRPDVVVQIYVDRALAKHRPRIEGEAGRALLERWFEESREVAFRAAPPALDAFGGAIATATGEVRVGGPADLVYLPAFDFPARGAILALDLECEQATALRLYYRTESETELSRSVYLRARAPAGRGRAYFELAEPGLTGRLLLGFGREAQAVRILAVEVRGTG